jgi:hypothetical protein
MRPPLTEDAASTDLCFVHCLLFKPFSSAVLRVFAARSASNLKNEKKNCDRPEIGMYISTLIG